MLMKLTTVRLNFSVLIFIAEIIKFDSIDTITNIAVTPSVNFTNLLRTAFMLVDPESVKNTVKSFVTFYAFGICMR